MDLSLPLAVLVSDFWNPSQTLNIIRLFIQEKQVHKVCRLNPFLSV